MRFNRVDLIRYGKFTDRSIALPAPNTTSGQDFHLIFGPNEAGKSTTRNALSDLLFGIEPRTRYDFIHDKSAMRLGAQLQMNGATIAFQRVKRNKQALRDMSDATLPDDVLVAYTGVADRSSFEREFCLDQTRLEEGGKSILDAKDDVGRMLFEAAAGVNIFSDIFEQLDKESAVLWKARRSKDQAFYKALDAFKAAQKELKALTIRSKTWRLNNQKVTAAEEALNAATQEYEVLEHERERLERIRRVAPHLQALNTKLEASEVLGDAVNLPEGAAKELAAVKKDLIKYDQQLIEYQALIDNARKDQKGVAMDESVLLYKTDIMQLHDEKIRTENHPANIAKHEAESLALSKDINALLTELDWKPSGEEAIAGLLPSTILRQEIESLANNYGRLALALESTTEQLKRVERDGNVFFRERQAIAEVPTPQELKSLLAAARALGDTENSKEEMRIQLALSTEALNSQITKLQPWHGSIQALRELAVPSDIEVQEFKESERSILAELKNVTQRLEEVEAECQAVKLKENRFVEKSSAITHEEIVRSRQDREALWGEIKAGKKAISNASDAYEARVSASDKLADSRYQYADEVKEIEGLRAQIKTLNHKHATQDKKRTRIQGQLHDLHQKWQVLVQRLNLSDMSISSVQSWLGHYKEALSDAQKLLREEESLKRLKEKENTASCALRQALININIPEKDLTKRTLPELIVEAEKQVSEHDALNARRQQLEAQIQRNAIELAEVNARVVKARAEMDAWNTEWPMKIEAAHLADSITPKTAAIALALIGDVKEKLKEKQNLQASRIAVMQRDIASFEERAKTLARALAAEWLEKPAVDICQGLCQRLNKAEQARNTLEKTTQDIEENKAQYEKVIALKEIAQARLLPYMQQAKATDIKALEGAIALSERLGALKNEIEEKTNTVIEFGDGMPLEDLRGELIAEDLTTIAVRLDALKAQRNAAIEKRDDCFAKQKEAEAQRDKTGGQADAAMAEVQRQDALAKMVEVTERFIKVHIGKRLLQFSMERYREQKRGPLLERAGEIFSMLTLESFTSLEIDYDDIDKPRLMGRRPDGRYVDFDGLSEGTGDQLFLSLRLAAVELQLQHSQALPFIADDLFTNYSDNRALQGFKVFGELSTKSQVIYFTHHEHLVDIARKAIGQDLNVVNL